MNLFARILSHGFALVVVALLAIGLIYRGELFPEWNLPDTLSLGQEQGDAGNGRQTDAGQAEEVEPAQTIVGEITTGVSAVPEEEVTPSAAIDRGVTESAGAEVAVEQESARALTAGQSPVAAGANTEAPVTAGQEAAEETVPSAAEMQEIPPQSSTAMAEDAAQQPGAAAVVSPDIEQPAVSDTTAAGMSAETGGEYTGTAEVTTAPSQTHEASGATPYKILAAAREAYWLRDYAVAELKYEELIAFDPDNPDGYGELGNMYFSQGDWDKATASYYEAGLRLAAQGLFDRARQLVEVIRGLNGGQGDDLEQQINAAESAAD
jgi:tetratricopeptide (TPR) repeat protein